MSQLDDLLKLWTETQNVEDIINSGFLKDQKAIQDRLAQKSGDDFKTAITLMSQISSAISLYIADLDEKKKEVKAQIDQNLKSAQACISYGSASGIEKKGKDKD